MIKKKHTASRRELKSEAYETRNKNKVGQASEEKKVKKIRNKKTKIKTIKKTQRE